MRVTPRPALALLAMALSVVTSCRTPAEDPSRLRTVRMVLRNDPSSLSLIGKTDYNSDILARLISDSLVQYDAKLNFRPRLAESWVLSADGRTVTFRLKAGVKWQDGTPFSSRDVVYTVKKVREPATEARTWVGFFEDVVSIEAPDELTVRVSYAEPHADFLDAWRLPIVPEHLAERDKDFLTGSFANHPVGCGAFRFASRKTGSEIVLEANHDYWEGRPSVDRLVFEILPSDRTAYEALVNGDIDLMALTPDLWQEAQASPRTSRLARVVYYPLRVYYLGWNQDGSNPFFGDPRVRRAMVLALDRERFIARVFRGLARAAVTTYHPDSVWADPTLAPWPYDPVEAGRLLDEAGWRDSNGDGVRDRGEIPFRFTLMIPASTQEVTDRTAAWVQQSLASIGIKMEIEKLEWRTIQERRGEHRFQAAMASLSFTPVPDQHELYHSSSRKQGFNYVGFADPETDRLLEEGRKTFDPLARQKIYFHLQRRLHDLEPISCLFHSASPLMYDARLEGVEPSPLGPLEIVPGPPRWRWAGTSPGG